MLNGMRKIFLAAFLGIILGTGLFLSPVPAPPNAILQTALPQVFSRQNIVAQQDHNDLFFGVGILLGVLVGGASFLIAKRRSG
jgi:hypothetical protein